MYLLVSGPTNGLTMSCTRALEANSSPTLTFSSSKNSLSSLHPCWSAELLLTPELPFVLSALEEMVRLAVVTVIV